MLVENISFAKTAAELDPVHNAPAPVNGEMNVFASQITEIRDCVYYILAHDEDESALRELAEEIAAIPLFLERSKEYKILWLEDAQVVQHALDTLLAIRETLLYTRMREMLMGLTKYLDGELRSNKA